MFLMIGQRFLMRSLPQNRGDLNLPNIHSRINIYRDGYGIPHIITDNEHDLFYAQGFVTAQDRLWQMDFWKRAACGRLSEIFGPSTVRHDSLVLTVGIPDVAGKLEESISKKSHDILSAYVEGINAYIDAQNGKWPIEFLLFGYKPEKWQINDCLAVLRWTGWHMTAGTSHDLIWNAMKIKLEQDALCELLPAGNYEMIADVKNDPDRAIKMLKQAERFIHENGPVLPSGQNQCLVLSGERTSTGKPILAAEMLFPFSCPAILYEVHLTSKTWNASGFSMPGIPLIYIGYNEHIAWAFSSRPEKAIHYTPETVYNGLPANRRIKVRNQKSRQCLVREASSGPIIAESRTDDGDPLFLSLQWKGYKKSDEILALLKLNTAENWTSFRNAVKTFGFPEQEVLYADRNGNIGADKTGFSDINVTPNSSGSSSMQTVDQAIFNPESNYIIKSDNSLWNDSFLNSHRAARMRKRLSESDKWSLMDIKKIYNDVQSPYAEQIMQKLLPILNEITFENDFEIKTINQFKNWSGNYKTGSYGAVLFHIFQIYFTKNTLLDDLGNDLIEQLLSHPDLYCRLTLSLFNNERSHFFDDISTTDQTETLDDMIKISLKQSVVWAAREFGTTHSKWAWGMGHTMTIRHPLESLPMMKNVLNLGPFPVSGDYTSVHCMTSDLNKPYEVIWGPTARLIVDLHRLDNAISVLSTGQSGQFMDDHYRDQVQLLINHLYHPNLMDTARVVQSGWPVLTIKPGPHHE